MDKESKCPICKGTGEYQYKIDTWMKGMPCIECGGSGKNKEQTKEEV